MPEPRRVVNITDPCRTRRRECVALHLNAALLAGSPMPVAPARKMAARSRLPMVDSEDLQASVAEAFADLDLAAV